MKQALHIFKKDVRYLRIEIAFILLLAAALALGVEWTPEILELAGLYLVARLIHAETIPGDRQFWLTRPYRPMNLLGAKLLFIFTFLCAPIGIAQAVLALRLGFPLAYEIPGLLWTQVLIFVAAVIPVAALASVTAGLVPFILAVLLLAATAIFGASGVHELFPGRIPGGPVASAWIKVLPFGIAIGCLSAAILLWQYRARATLFSRLFGVIAYTFVFALYLFLPASLPLAVQTWFSKKPELASGVRLSVRPAPSRAPLWRGSRTTLVIPVPLAATGLPHGVEVRPDDISISFAWPDRTWSPTVKTGVNPHYGAPGEAVIDLLVQMDAPVFRAEYGAPMTIRGSAYLTLFGEPERRTVPLKQGPQNVQDGLQCFAGEFLRGDYLLCRSFFRWPDRLVRVEGAVADFGDSIVSYSPFPADLNLNPLEVHFTESTHLDTATIVTIRPLVHFKRDFEIEGICLAQFEEPPVIRSGPVCPTNDLLR